MESLRAVGAPRRASAPASPQLPEVRDPALGALTAGAGEGPLPDAVLERMYQARQEHAATAARDDAADRNAGAPALEAPAAGAVPLSPPPADSAPAPPALEPPPLPPVKAAQALKLPTVSPLNRLPAPEPARPAEPNVKIFAEFVSDEPHGLFGGRRKIPDFSPPTVLHGAPPQVPPEVRSRISREVDIDVKLYVNETGQVDYSELSSEHVKSDRDLEALAVFAGRKWEFVPARIAGRNAPSEVILHFRFAPAPDSASLERAASGALP